MRTHFSTHRRRTAHNHIITQCSHNLPSKFKVCPTSSSSATPVDPTARHNRHQHILSPAHRLVLSRH